MTFNLERLARVLQPGSLNDPVAKAVDIFLLGLILANVVAIVLESVPSINLVYRQFFLWFEVISVVIFSIEYVLRVLAAPRMRDESLKLCFKTRWAFVRSPMAIIDLLAILPFYLSFFIALDTRFLRVLRLLRILRLSRYSSAMTTLLIVLREEGDTVMAALFILLLLLVLTSCGIYLIEHEVQPEKFGSIPAAMWWAMATLTTVGYGDVTPITPLGKFFGGVVTLIGMGMVALPAGILASGFSEQLHRSRKQYLEALDKALEDGTIDERERLAIDRLRHKLGVTQAAARDLEQSVVVRERESAEVQQSIPSSAVPHACPHCGKSLSAREPDRA